jgi:hypothetical protein
MVGWDNVPMHRWAQSQLFRSLCLLLKQESSKIADQNAPGAPLTEPLEQPMQSSSTK